MLGMGDVRCRVAEGALAWGAGGKGRARLHAVFPQVDATSAVAVAHSEQAPP